MAEFQDFLTGRVYRAGDKWLAYVQSHLATLLSERLQRASSRDWADVAAKFWSQDYHELVFPLRFGFVWKSPRQIEAIALFGEAQQVDLDSFADRPLRSRRGDTDRLPPIWPGEEGNPQQLVPERALVQALVLNLLLRKRQEVSHLGEARLGCLLAPLLDALQPKFPLPDRAVQVAEWFLGRRLEPPEGLPEDVLRCARDQSADGVDASVALGLVAVQRIKTYVFESHGLPEIRGASTLLDICTEEGARRVAKELGPEVVLRAAGSTLVFLAPDESTAERLCHQIRADFLEKTTVAHVADATCSVSLSDLLGKFQEAMGRAFARLEQRRSQTSSSMEGVLPFEARCSFCGIRPAEGWVSAPEEPRLSCEPCAIKRSWGLKERKRKADELLAELGLSDPDRLGVDPKDYVAEALGEDSDAERGFIPTWSGRKLLATVYGDGNNFGAVNQRLGSLALALQWTHRVARTTRLAAAIGLAAGTMAAADRNKPLRKLPFQVLQLGGDDLCLFAWSPVALYFAETFLRLTDLEFEPSGNGSWAQRPPSFSLGLVVTDRKASVRRTVQMAEDEVLAWAKRAHAQDPSAGRGTMSYVLAPAQDQLPDDFSSYLGSGSAGPSGFADSLAWEDGYFVREDQATRLCLTLRPYRAAELAFLRQLAENMRGSEGPIQRLTRPFLRHAPTAALLHFAYQAGRLGRRRGGKWIASLLGQSWPGCPDVSCFPGVPSVRLKGRLLLGLRPAQPGKITWFSPLLDLLEWLKMLD
ncbi:MAG: hypothetical protein ONB23_08395 [candidate division KSB1 bacterium]|nr:hypothetical protein [candidate division KSB1 bacterium]